jgi:hypothetical protein
MTILNDIRRMQSEGKTDQEIIAALKEQGISPREITESLTQSKIKEAVTGGEGYETSTQVPGAAESMPMPEEAQAPVQPAEITPSMAAPEEYAPSAQAPAEAAPAYAPAEAQYQEYPQYQQYPQGAMGGISPDTITEISEQVVAEKLSPLRRDIEKVIDLKTTVESKMEYMDERLKRIEKIMDRLQLSIMQKVGDYMTNIEDIKKEIQETQKSFKSISETKPEKPRKSKESEAAE